MKKINKGFKFLLVLSIFLSTGSTVFATPVTDLDGEGGQTAPIEVNSHIGGFDSTDPYAPDPLGPDDVPDPSHPTWLNITVPTTVLFQSAHVPTNLTSANFDIANNSGRGVDVFVNSFEHDTSSDDFDDIIASLDLVATGGVTNNTVELIDEGSITHSTPELLMTIARGTRPTGATTTTPTVATFNFDGELEELPTNVINPSFDLVLGFTVNGEY